MVPAAKAGAYGRTRSRSAGGCGAYLHGRAHREGFAEMTDNIWTDEKIEMLRNLVAAKQSSGQIALKMNITRNAVIGKAYRLGLSLLSAPKTPSGRASRARQKPSAPTVLQPSKPISVPPPEAPTVVPFIAPQPRKDGQLHDTLSIADRCCKWVVDGAGKNARYCGHDAVPKRSWCAYHMTRFLEFPKQEAAQ